MCSLALDSDRAEQIRDSALTVWVECFMQPRHCLESVDRLYRDICHEDTPFGGKVVMFSGDPLQILPVVPRDNESAIVAACRILFFLSTCGFNIKQTRIRPAPKSNWHSLNSWPELEMSQLFAPAAWSHFYSNAMLSPVNGHN
jgi:hypothetical protein